MKYRWLILLLMSCMSVRALEPVIAKQIDELVQTNPGQLNAEEYRCIAEVITSKSPCNVLVFGVGKDSRLWIDCNKNGKTVFVEDSYYWFRHVRAMILDINAILVNYGTTVSQWRSLLENPDTTALKLDLSSEVMKFDWDVIFVDAPYGGDENAPGRMKSIYMSSYFAKKNPKGAHVFVHDCNREVEKVYSSTFLGEENFMMSVSRLRHYYVRSN